MKETQLLKGVLEGCVLSIIGQKESYGYELVQALRRAGFENMTGGTVYPLLQKLEKQGYLTTTVKPSSDGPDRKYFQLSDTGQAYLASFEVQWTQLIAKVNGIIRQGGQKDV